MFEDDGRVRVKYDGMHLDASFDGDGGDVAAGKRPNSGRLPPKEVVIAIGDGLSKAPPETELKAHDQVRVVQSADSFEGYKWQYSVVRHVHSKLLIDINFDSGEYSRGLPCYAHEVQRAV